MLKAEKNYFTLNGKPFYIYSGEIHYFRLPPSKWKLHLKRAKEAGLNTVSTYIPWSWHEYEEGKYDFNGRTHPQRNLSRYLKEVKDAGLYLSVRIGPFSNAELKGEGLPSWLLKDHPEIYSTGEGVQNLPHTVLISYANPVFRNYVRKWYDRVIPQIKPFQASNGGNVVLVQLCNEIGMIQWVNNRGDYTPQATKKYQKYLREKYKTINRLEKLYPGSSFNKFTEIKQPSQRQSYGWQDFWDWADFYRHYFADYYEYLYKLAVQRGLDTPFIANIPQFIDFDVRGRGFASPMTTSFYRYIPDKVKNVVYGGAYQMRRMDYENFHDVLITTQVVKALTGYSNPAICAELQTGIMRDKPRLYPSDVELNLKTSMASGIDGVNCYMFSGGENPDNIGMFGKKHEWQAPVSSQGNTDEKFVILNEYGELIKTFGSTIAQSQPLFQTTFGIYPPYYGTEFLNYDSCGFLIYTRDRYFFDGIGRLLNMASINFGIVDLYKQGLDPKKVKDLWIFSLSFMDKGMQDMLVDYVKNGGKLVLFPEFPEHDLSGTKCTKILDEFGVKVCDKIFPSLVDFNGKECYVEGAVSTVEVKGKYQKLISVNGKLCGFSKNIGKGKLVFIGAPIPHYYDYQADIMSEIAGSELGVTRNVTVTPKDIVGLLRVGSKGSFLFLNNYHQKKYIAGINVNVPQHNIKIKHENIHLAPRMGKVLPINVVINSNTKILFCSVEVLSFRIRGKEIKARVRGCSGEEAKLILDIKGKKKTIIRKLKEKITEVKILL
jgi:beta-galactosidase